jgi:hypothetical protein
MKIIHIGLPKTGTTSLQNNIYPVLSHLKKFKWYKENNNKLYQEIRDHIARMRFGYDINKIDLNDKDFISDEGLCGWDPHFWEEFSEKNLAAFGKDTHVILTVRKPSDFLNSVYIQTCLHEGDIQEPKDFFLKKNFYSERLETAKFSIEEFSYSKLINYYTTKFDKVTVVKYEDLKNLSFLKDIFYLSNDELTKLQAILSSKKNYNRAFSDRGKRIVYKLSFFLNLFGLSLSRGTNKRTLYELKMLKDYSYRSKVINKKEASLIKKILLVVIKELNWRNFIQERIDKILPYKKFSIDFDDLEIDIHKYNEDYKKL